MRVKAEDDNRYLERTGTANTGSPTGVSTSCLLMVGSWPLGECNLETPAETENKQPNKTQHHKNK